MILTKLFDEFNKEKINYCVLRKYKNLPKKPKGDVDILVYEDDLNRTTKIIEKLGFIKYPYVEPHYFYFYHEKQLICLDLITYWIIGETKKYKNFYVPVNWNYKVKKNIFYRLFTNLLRKLHYLGKGKLITFVGPDGSGKTTTINCLNKKLKNFPIKKRNVMFAKGTYSKIKRSFDLISIMISIELSLFMGKIVLCDRYMYLTFRRKPRLRKILFKVMRKPHISYFLTNSPNQILKRKKELTKDEIKNQLDLFNGLTKSRKEFKVIHTNKSADKISDKITRDILSLYR